VREYGCYIRPVIVAVVDGPIMRARQTAVK
jgi:hypothetical protein